MANANHSNGIFQYLDCSTIHVTKKDMDLFGGVSAHAILAIYTYPEGAWVYVVKSDDVCNKLREIGFSEGFINVMDIAHSKGCYFIRLDCDGTIHDELKQFDWE